MPRITLIGSRDLSPRVSHFSFQATFRHHAGQHVALRAEIEGSRTIRYFSIASPPLPSGTIEFCIRHDGRFGAHLRDLRPGDTVQCSEPAGQMRLRNPSRPAVYFAAGTGVSPMRAILLEQLAASPDADAVLTLGARHVEELLYRDAFEALASRHSGFRFVPVLSRGTAGWQGGRGHVTDHVGPALAPQRDVDAYFCGPPAMVAEMRARLARAGIAEERQCFERY